MTRVDLHSHTNLSDGSLAPRDLIRLAARLGVEVLAVTDHDTTEGLAEAEAEARQVGMRLIDGIEVSSELEGKGVHILGYFPAGARTRLAGWQVKRRDARRARMHRMVERLAELGLPIDAARLEAGADPRRSPGRLHVAQALVAAGHVATTQEAFERWLGDDKPAWIRDVVPTAKDAIALVHDLGGLAVVAHPALDRLDEKLPLLRDAGLDGVEAFHGGHAPEVAAALAARATELGLLITGGSDYHGGPTRDPTAPPDDGENRLGKTNLPQEAWDRFDAALSTAARAQGR
jgi:predicted metal-dependent phosphoesterase TrpH